MTDLVLVITSVRPGEPARLRHRVPITSPREAVEARQWLAESAARWAEVADGVDRRIVPAGGAS